MIVELVGLPGSGKTTFAKKLASESLFTIITINNPGELLLYNLSFFLCHPIYFFKGIYWMIRHLGHRALWYTKFMNLFLVHNAKYMKAGKYPRAIIDQGHHQNIISLFDTRVDDVVIEHYLGALPKPDLLCFFLADEETRTSRLVKRGYGARGELNEDYREAWEDAREKHFAHAYLLRDTLPCATETATPENEEKIQIKIRNARMWFFVMQARMPTEKAHGFQIAKTIEALIVLGDYVALWVPKRKNNAETSVGDYYGLRVAIPVRFFSTMDFFQLPKFLGTIRFFLNALVFFFALLFTRLDKGAIYYTRNPELVWLLSVRGVSAWYEAHLFPSSKVFMLKFFLRHVSGIVANSSGTRDAFIKQGFPVVHVARNGVDLERFLSAPGQVDARVALDIPSKKTVIMYVGAFYEWKGVPLLVASWKKHFAERGDLMLILVGGGEEDLKNEGAFANYQGCTNIMLVPHVSSERIPTYLAAADMLVLPNISSTLESIRYTSPIKLFEYMSSARLIIAANLPSIREILSEQISILVSPDDTDALASGIKTALDNPEEAKKIGARARTAALAYSWEKRAGLLSQITSSVDFPQVHTLVQFIKSALSGGFTALCYLLLVYIFTEYAHFEMPLAILIAYLCALAINFQLLRSIFIGGANNVPAEIYRYFSVALLNIILNEGASYVLVEWYNLWYMLAQVLIVGSLTVANFFMYRIYVFQRKI